MRVTHNSRDGLKFKLHRNKAILNYNSIDGPEFKLHRNILNYNNMDGPEFKLHRNILNYNSIDGPEFKYTQLFHSGTLVFKFLLNILDLQQVT